ncbi:DUF6500 family protein [Thalassospira povalilytica]|uniref:DUF6500 family protein n=1 Tax=Thalassospira povalilytica TaxID=732237 RepID=UPI001D186697|nr:DUF6500 family protein [Thalassospira povalilytica]MCC4242396.1 DUF6500 family protein [Thalassospira povalilytica]
MKTIGLCRFVLIDIAPIVCLVANNIFYFVCFIVKAVAGLSFYAFFANRNNDPALLMEAATWWIETRQLDHFEKATKIREMVLAGK